MRCIYLLVLCTIFSFCLALDLSETIHQEATKLYTLDACKKTTECEGHNSTEGPTKKRSCRVVASNNKCTANDNRCVCVPEQYTKCSSDDQCKDQGAVCRRLSNYEAFCVSTTAIAAIETGDNPKVFVGPTEAPVYSSCFSSSRFLLHQGQTVRQGDTSGLTGRTCTSNDQCKGGRACITYVKDRGFECCDGEKSCACYPMRAEICTADSACSDGEVCPDTSLPSFCLVDGPATIFTGFPESTEDVCVAIHHLEHLHGDDLIYEKHHLSRVFCDVNNSCATHGHMVLWEGKQMMMKSYCDIVGCKETVMKVNSPKYQIGRVVASKTDGLVFSALAARYGSRVEEVALGALIRMGA